MSWPAWYIPECTFSCGVGTFWCICSHKLWTLILFLGLIRMLLRRRLDFALIWLILQHLKESFHALFKEKLLEVVTWMYGSVSDVSTGLVSSWYQETCKTIFSHDSVKDLKCQLYFPVGIRCELWGAEWSNRCNSLSWELAQNQSRVMSLFIHGL